MPSPISREDQFGGGWFGWIQRWFAQRAEQSAPGGPDGVLGYLGVRRAIGWLGLGLPVALPAVTWIFGRTGMSRGPVLRGSLSAYYYSGIGGSLFVGTIFAIGIFLLCYRYRKLDDRLGDVACGSAIGLALFPTADDGVPATWTIGYLHLIFASVFLVTLTLICAFIFTLGDPAIRTPRKRIRNRVYFICAGVMTLALIGALSTQFFHTWHYALLVFETLAVWAFGFAWIVKGEVLFKDAEAAAGDGALVDGNN